MTNQNFPSDWKAIRFGDFTIRENSKFDPKSNKDSYPCIELEHISQGTGKILGHILAKEQKSTKNVFKAENVLFGKLRPNLKKFAQPNFDGVCSSEIWVMNAIEKECDNTYLFYLVQSDRFQHVANVTSGTKMPRSDWNYVSKAIFYLPPLPEQRAIAEILSTRDEAIAITEQLIAVLKKRKKGLMQRLLTGQIRFPGFNQEWKEEKLSNICDITTGKMDANHGDNGGEYPFYTCADKPIRSPTYSFDGDSIIMPGNGANVGLVWFYSGKFEAYQRTYVLNNFKCNPLFLFQHLLANWKKANESIQYGSATNYIRIQNFDIYKILLPTIAEQEKIVELLQTYDREIQLFKQKLTALQKQKKGLMQRLLTGKVRVNPERFSSDLMA